jgi:prevent-host-death family protein
MASYNVHEAKSNLSKLLKQAEQGEEVVIMRDGQAVAKLVRCRPARQSKIRLGWAKGQAQAKPGWEKPLSAAEVEALFGGRV